MLYDQNGKEIVLPSKDDVNKKVSKSGDTMTGLLISPYIETGTDNTHYIQSHKIRSSGNANSYYHALDLGYDGNNKWDFHEYGGTFNFYKNTSGTDTSGILLGSINNKGWDGKVNNHTINSDVPANAKFTDTIYDDTSIKSSIATNTKNITTNTNDITTIKKEQTTQNTNIGNKQDKLTAGNNITISNNTISAKDTTYSNATSSANGLMSKEDKSKLDNILKLVYPVGSIYMSVNNTNPASLFGGTWEQIKDRFLLSAGNSYANGSTGGSATHTIAVGNLPAHTHTYSNATAVQEHTLTIDEIPKHTHNLRSNHTAGGPYATPIFDFNEGHSSDDSNAVLSAGGGKSHNHGLTKATANTSSTGSGTALNTMPPYLAVYMWKRTA